LKSFIQSVKHRRQPLVTGQIGRDALKTALSIMAQIKKTSQHLVNDANEPVECLLRKS